jgi:exonuclease III
MDVFKIATLNINGLASRTKVEILQDFLRRREKDIPFLQEIAHSTIDTLRSYKTSTNVRTAGRGTAVVTRNEITITHITRLPSGREIAAKYRGIRLVNVYVPSRKAK